MKRKGLVIGLICIAAALVVIVLLAYAGVLGGGMGKKERIVGTDIPKYSITEFYFTYDSSTYPPEFQRYRISSENGKHYFYHEKREGDHWPLTEEDATVKGTLELTDEEWDQAFSLLKGGIVTGREDSADSGGGGPWLYLYWNGDKGKYQVFRFESYGAQREYEELCVEWKERK